MSKTQKVFIPDNQGGGTWETWQDNRPNYKAHADKLAEALRHSADKLNDLSEWLKAYAEPKQATSVKAVETEAREALAAYEAAQ